MQNAIITTANKHILLVTKRVHVHARVHWPHRDENKTGFKKLHSPSPTVSSLVLFGMVSSLQLDHPRHTHRHKAPLTVYPDDLNFTHSYQKWNYTLRLSHVYANNTKLPLTSLGTRSPISQSVHQNRVVKDCLQATASANQQNTFSCSNLRRAKLNSRTIWHEKKSNTSYRLARNIRQQLYYSH